MSVLGMSVTPLEAEMTPLNFESSCGKNVLPLHMSAVSLPFTFPCLPPKFCAFVSFVLLLCGREFLAGSSQRIAAVI